MKLVRFSALLVFLGCGSSGNTPRDAAPSEKPADALGTDATSAEVMSDASDTTETSDHAEVASEAGGAPDVAVEHGENIEAGPGTHDAAGADSACAAGCTASTATATFCKAGETQWTCQSGKFNPTSFNTYCRDAGTDAIRYCCPPTFVPLCD